MPDGSVPFPPPTLISESGFVLLKMQLTNRCSGCWTNALQPLWLAGKVMSHHTEHEVLIETLTRIEGETGWATAWRVDDLKELWGDDEDEDEDDGSDSSRVGQGN
jgi:hypothetical protein